MAYPNTIKSYVTRIDKNASGYVIGPEYFNVPLSGPYDMYLDHVPKDSATTSVGASGGSSWTQVYVAPAATTQYLVDYSTGKVTFHSSDSGAAVEATYKNLGDDIMAEHINDLQEEITRLEQVLGIGVDGGYPTLDARLDAISSSSIVASGINGQFLTDDTVRAGALRNDIKGITWDVTKDVLTDISAHRNNASAHAAGAITLTPPGSTAASTVQGHANLKGSASQTPTNPHGVAFGDLGPITTSYDANFNNMYAKLIGISGVMFLMNILGPDANQGIYFYDNGSPIGQKFGWDNTNSKFQMSTTLAVNGGVDASGNIMPDASGTRSVGTAAIPWGTGNYNEVQSTLFKTGGSNGATGQFISQDSKTVMVRNGIIISIV